MSEIKKEFVVKGMTCGSCVQLIKDEIGALQGVNVVEVSLEKETASVNFNEEETSIDLIVEKIESNGFKCDLNTKNQEGFDLYEFLQFASGITVILLAGYFILNFVDGFNVPQLDQNMSYGLLFVVGLLTGFHCISMCGGFVISYTTNAASKDIPMWKPHSMYAIGKLISYTVIGAFFGFVGEIIAFTPMLRGSISVLAGIFLLLFGLRMANLLPGLRKFGIKTPKFIEKFVLKVKESNSSALIFGLLNGLLIYCGPLQAMYIMAIGTGSFIEGAKLLFIFGLGTLPVMIGFGFLTSVLSYKWTNKIFKASAMVIFVLGLYMLNNGLVLTGAGYDLRSTYLKVSGETSISQKDLKNLQKYVAKMGNGFQVINMDVDRYGWATDKFILKKGVPVRWIINGKEINYCNNAISVPQLGLNFSIKPGKQVIQFTPEKEGLIPWSCWMGMIPGTFIVKNDINLANSDTISNIKSDLIKSNQYKKSGPGQSCSGGQCGNYCAAKSGKGTCGCGAKKRIN